MSPTGDLHVTTIFLWEEAASSLLRRSCVLPWPGTLPGAAHPLGEYNAMSACGLLVLVLLLWPPPAALCCLPLGVPCCSGGAGVMLKLVMLAGLRTLFFSLTFGCFPATVCLLSQCSLHNAPIFRLLLKVAVNGTHQCESLNFCGA